MTDLLKEKVGRAEEALKLAAKMSREYYEKPLVISISGGKDSDVMLHIAENCLHPDEYEVMHSLTSVDAPDTVYHIREELEHLQQIGVNGHIRKPRYEASKNAKTETEYRRSLTGKQITMWNLAPLKQIPPTRIARYCCAVLKETGTPNRVAALGVRGAESANRRGRDVFSTRGGTLKQATHFSLDHAVEVYRESHEIGDPAWDCTMITTMKNRGEILVNPIYEFTDSDIWDYINYSAIKTNPLYKCGFTRVGCIGCPMATYKIKMFEYSIFPKYKLMWINAFDRMLEERRKAGKTANYARWKDAQGVFDWWIESPDIPGQMELDLY